VAGLALALPLALAGPASAVPPTGDFTMSPTTANPGEDVTFTPKDLNDPEVLPILGGIDFITFTFPDDSTATDTDAPFDAPAIKHAFTTAGTKTVTMRIVDIAGEDTFVAHTIRINAAPTAAFTFSPASPDLGERVSFSAAPSTDDVALPANGYQWDFNDDGNWDATGQTVTHEFANSGDRTVRLRVTDTGGRADAVTRVVHVNQAPKASFVYSPRSPKVNDRVSFTSSSDDPDDPIASQAWDLDGDGQYDDARGDTASRQFAAAGPHTVRLRVTDSHGRSDAVAATVNVVSLPKVPPKRMRPWPRIRIVGYASSRRVRVDLLTVRTVRGANVKVRCAGRGCPRTKAVSTRASATLVRVRWLERRLRTGTRIYIAVTAPGSIGRYEKILLRSRKEPLRSMLCLYPGQRKARKCGK
jgi:PKD repeat protein